MASFDRDTPVLRLNYGKDPTARYVLWPVFAWRVVAPLPRDRSLNLFQRAVLSLSRAGCSRISDVAEQLLIAPDLAALVVQELQGMGMIDQRGDPSKRGLGILEDLEDEPPDESRVGHVLSDPFTGKLWPRFVTGDLPLADFEINDGGWPVLLSGSAGDPWKDAAFCILPGARDRVMFAQPSARDVLRATRRHRRQRDFDGVYDDRDVPRLRRVSFVDEQPQPLQIALRLRPHPSGDWMVDDPFGHGEAVDLRVRLEERLDTYPGLRRWLSSLVGSDPESPTMTQLQAEANWKVEERLTMAVRQFDAVHDRLVAMQRAHLEAAAVDAPLDKWDDVLLKAQRAVERTLHLTHQPYRDSRPPLYSSLAASDKRLNRRHLDAIASDLGFRAPLPESLSSVRRGKVQYAEQRMSGSLRPLVLLALLASGRDGEHPLAKSGAAQPDLLHRLDALATARDRAAHDGSAAWPERVGQHVETAFLTVQHLLLQTH